MECEERIKMKNKWSLNKRKGSALIWMLLAFSVLMILTTSIFYIVRQDLYETAKQEERLQTYYIALSGVDLTYAALMDPANEPKKIESAISKLKSKSTPITDTIIIDIDGEEKGTATVSIDRIKDEKDIYWIRITSVGQLTGKSVTVSSTMRINESNYNQIVREKL
jgi:hypothetical protein